MDQGTSISDVESSYSSIRHQSMPYNLDRGLAQPQAVISTDTIRDRHVNHALEIPPRPERIIPILDRGQVRTPSVLSSSSSSSSQSEGPWIFSTLRRLATKARELTSNDEDEYMPYYRLTPNISGIAMPFAILLQIPGLTEHWYIKTMDNKTVQMKPNPPLLDVGLAFSMAFALLANLCFIGRFLERRVFLMTILTILFLTVQDIINTVAVTVFGVAHRFNDGFVYGQSFWVTVCATTISLLANLSVIYDFVTTRNFASSGSGLTRKQRSLVIIVMILLCWIAFGALINSFLLHLSFIDALYFTVVSIETIGFGDIHPTSTGSRVFIPFYVSFGIVALALMVKTCRETVMEYLEHSYRLRIKKIREKMTEARMHRVTGKVFTHAIEKQLRTAGLPLYTRSRGAGVVSHRNEMMLNVAALTPEQRQAALQEAFRLEPESAASAGDHNHGRLTTFLSLMVPSKSIDEMDFSDETAFQRSLEREARRVFWAQLSVAGALFLTFWMTGSAIFQRTEGWSFGVAVYFCFIAFSTIGYGDFSPLTPAGRSIFVAWALLGVATMTVLISVLSEAFSSHYENALHEIHYKRAFKRYRTRSMSELGTSRRGSFVSEPDTHFSEQSAQTETKSIQTERRQHSASDATSHAKNLLQQYRYFTEGNVTREPLTPKAHQLMEKIAEMECLEQRLKDEVFRNREARKTVFVTHFLKCMQDIVLRADNRPLTQRTVTA